MSITVILGMVDVMSQTVILDMVLYHEVICGSLFKYQMSIFKIRIYKKDP